LEEKFKADNTHQKLYNELSRLPGLDDKNSWGRYAFSFLYHCLGRVHKDEEVFFCYRDVIKYNDTFTTWLHSLSYPHTPLLTSSTPGGELVEKLRSFCVKSDQKVEKNIFDSLESMASGEYKIDDTCRLDSKEFVTGMRNILYFQDVKTTRTSFEGKNSWFLDTESHASHKETIDKIISYFSKREKIDSSNLDFFKNNIKA
jgi:hypothetical protein